jgi:ASC-1-like (ASCH) protein
MLNLRLKKIYFDLIKNGKKTVEGRINTAKYRNMRPGDKIQFSLDQDGKNSETLVCIVEKITVYPDFFSMLCAEGIENMLPGITTIEDGVSLYENFPGYKSSVQENGALAIKIRVENTQNINH